jgi:HK97 family phage portal protein
MGVYTAAPSSRSRLGASSLQTKADPTAGVVVSSYGLSDPIKTPRRFDTLATEGYMQSPPVFAAINKIAASAAGIPWALYKRSGGKRKGKVIDDHPLLDLMQTPNATQGWSAFFQRYVGFLYIAGNSYVYLNRASGGKGVPLELWSLRPDRMRVKPDAKNFVGGYRYEVNGKTQDFSTLEVLHTKTFAPLDDFYGLSPLVVAARAIDIRNSGGDWNLALVQQSGRQPGFFVAKERLGDKQFERMRGQIVDRYSGARNAGLPGLLEDGLTWVSNGMTPLDMDWGNADLRQTRDIAITLGVPPEMLGDPEMKTYASYSEARASFYTETILPLMDMLREELNRSIVPAFGTGLYLDYLTEEIEALAPIRAARWSQVKDADWLRVNEKRQATGYEEIDDDEGGDAILVPVATATLAEIVDDTKPGPAESIDPSTGLPTPPAPDATPPDGTPPATPGDKPDDASKPDANAAPHDPLDDVLAGKSLDNGVDGATATAAILLAHLITELERAGKLTRPKAKSRSLSTDEKAAEWKRVEAARGRWYRKATTRVRDRFDDERQAVIKAISDAHDRGIVGDLVDGVLDQQEQAWTATLKSLIEDVGQDIAGETYESLKRRYKGRTRKDVQDAVLLADDWLTYAAQVMATRGASKVVGIIETTRRKLRGELTDALANEETIFEIVARIDALYLDQIIAHRSETIARTEVIGIANDASLYGAKATGLDLLKEWIATQDERTRDDHSAADGQQVKLAEPFVVGGLQTDTPGNTGDPGEDINCRCTQGYVVPDEG